MKRLIETISVEQIYSILNSTEFLDRIYEVNRRTMDTKKEYGFEVMKRIRNQEITFTHVVEGSENNLFPDFDVEKDKYNIMSIHSHTPDTNTDYDLASPRDFQFLDFLRTLNLAVSSIDARPIGIVLTYIEGEHEGINASLYQEKNQRLNRIVLAHLIENFDEDKYISVTKQLNLGSLFYLIKEARFCSRGYDGWIGEEQKIKDLTDIIQKFSFRVVQL